MPLKPSSISLSAQAGQHLLGGFPCREEVLQGEVQPGGHVVFADRLRARRCRVRRGPRAWGGGRRSRCRSVRRARGSKGPGPGGAGWASEAPLGSSFLPFSAGTGVVLTYWWASGRRGTDMPIISPILAPQKPAQETTISAGMTPSEVSTPVTRRPDCSIPVTVVLPRYLTPAASVRLISS